MSEGFIQWWGVAILVGFTGLALINPRSRTASPKEAWGFMLCGIAFGWFIRGPGDLW